LEKLFSGMNELKKTGEEVFIDRDGTAFENMVNYLRNERANYPQFENRNDEDKFLRELKFWEIDMYQGNQVGKQSFAQTNASD
jgi:predicted HTH transcriptional regulator